MHLFFPTPPAHTPSFLLLFTIGSLVEYKFVVTFVFTLASADHQGIICRLWDHVTLSGSEGQQQLRVNTIQWQLRVVTHRVHRHCVI